MGPSPPPSCILEQGGLSQTLDKVPARLKWLLPFPARVEHREKKMQHSPEGLAPGSLGIQCSPEVFLVQGHLRAGFERCKVKELSTGGQDCVSWFPKDVLLHRGWDTVTSQAGICWDLPSSWNFQPRLRFLLGCQANKAGPPWIASFFPKNLPPAMQTWKNVLKEAGHSQRKVRNKADELFHGPKSMERNTQM